MLIVTEVSLASTAFPVRRPNFKDEPNAQHDFRKINVAVSEKKNLT